MKNDSFFKIRSFDTEQKNCLFFGCLNTGRKVAVTVRSAGAQKRWCSAVFSTAATFTLLRLLDVIAVDKNQKIIHSVNLKKTIFAK